jgi:protein-disulfide isomerase
MEPNIQPAEKRAQSNQFLVPGAIIVAGAFIALAVYFGGSSSASSGGPVGAADVKIIPLSEKDHLRGSGSAELVIVEYSDTECPFCKVFHNTMNQVMSEYEGQVAWVYRHLPIPQLHAKAPMEAEATECVAELGGNQAFWTYLDSIFATTNSNDSLDPAQLPKLAVKAGVSESAFASCLSSGRYTEAVKKSAQEGFGSGARGTPFSIILDNKGKQVGTINGAEPIAAVRSKLDALLK